MYITPNPSSFTQREIAAALQIWNRAAVSLLDIRHNLISPTEAVRGYRLPASTFLYTSGGKAEILLNDTPYNVERFGLFHGGKGTEVSIQPRCDWLEYYMVLYKTGEPAFHRREYAKMLEQTDPFRQQYGFAPDNPIFLWELLRRMFEAWRQPTPLDRFYEKSAFYQLVHEIYKEMESGKINVLQPDTVEMARRYMEEHFDKAIAIQDICDMLGISYSHFHRSFKKKIGTGPQEYLINVRIAEAKRLLKSGCALIPDIAEYCGFQDERNFRRSFVKNTGFNPNAYREELPSLTKDYALGNLMPFPYNWESQVSLDELKGKGATFMFKQMRSKAVVAALSLMLLMSACGRAPANSNGADSTPTSAVTSQVETEGAEPVEEGTRIISTENGDVEIPIRAKRIVALTFYGEVLALGLTPVGMPDHWAFSGSPIEDLVSTIPKVTGNEDILAMEPDLIITDGKDNYEDLSKIAPTVYFSPWTDRSAEERLTVLADLLGIDEKTGQHVIQTYDQKIATAKFTLSEAGIAAKSITILTGSPERAGLVFSVYKGAHALYNELGLARPKKIQELYDQGEAFADISMEVLQEYCGDYIMIIGDDNTFAGNAVFDSIPAVKAGHVFTAPEALVNFSDVISVSSQIDFFVEQLLSVSDQS